MTQPTRYSPGQIGLHWLIAALLVPQFFLHDAIAHAWHAIGRGEAPPMTFLVAWHIYGGIAILLLMLARVLLRHERGVPPAPAGEQPGLQKLSRGVHLCLYAILFLLPLSGIAAWFGYSRPAGEFHELMKLPLLLLVSLHILGAFYNQFVLKNRLLARMGRAG